MSETLAERAERLADWNDGAAETPPNYTHDCLLFQQDLRAVLADNARLARERDEARFAPMGDNHHNAAACPYCNPKLREMIDKAVQRAVKAERDAAHAARAAAEAERDRCRAALRSVAGVAAVPWMDHAAQRLRIWKDARTALAAGKEETP